MKKSQNITLLAVAGVLIVGGLTAAILSLVLDKPSENTSGKDTTAIVLNDGSFDTNAKDVTVEYKYNDKGYLESEKYYKNGAFYGHRDYYYGEDADYSTLFDAEGNELGSTKTTYSSDGRIGTIEEYENQVLVKSTEYTYSSQRLFKKIVKTFEGTTEHAEKTFYHENGKKSEVILYTDDVEIGHYYYDTDGNPTDGGDAK